MGPRILVADRDSILKSDIVQITHKHPDFAHRIRSDLDPEELILESYPIALTNKIIPFQEESIRSQAETPPSPPRHSPYRNAASSRLHSQTSTVVVGTESLCSPEPNIRAGIKVLQTSQNFNEQAPFPVIQPLVTPTQQVFPPFIFSPHSPNPILTSCAITPVRRILPPFNATKTSLYQSAPRGPCHIPSTFFSPPRARPPSAALPHTGSHRRGCAQKGPPSLAAFNPLPKRIECGWPKPTLTLRHNVNTCALRDVLLWAWHCVDVGRVIGLHEAGMVKFRDVSRVREIKEVCDVLKVRFLGDECDRLLRRWEGADEDFREEAVDGGPVNAFVVVGDGVQEEREPVLVADVDEGVAAGLTEPEKMTRDMSAEGYAAFCAGSGADAAKNPTQGEDVRIKGKGTENEYDVDAEDMPPAREI